MSHSTNVYLRSVRVGMFLFAWGLLLSAPQAIQRSNAQCTNPPATSPLEAQNEWDTYHALSPDERKNWDPRTYRSRIPVASAISADGITARPAAPNPQTPPPRASRVARSRSSSNFV